MYHLMVPCGAHDTLFSQFSCFIILIPCYFNYLSLYLNSPKMLVYAYIVGFFSKFSSFSSLLLIGTPDCTNIVGGYGGWHCEGTRWSATWKSEFIVQFCLNDYLLVIQADFFLGFLFSFIYVDTLLYKTWNYCLNLPLVRLFVISF